MSIKKLRGCLPEPRSRHAWGFGRELWGWGRRVPVAPVPTPPGTSDIPLLPEDVCSLGSGWHVHRTSLKNEGSRLPREGMCLALLGPEVPHGPIMCGLRGAGPLEDCGVITGQAVPGRHLANVHHRQT